MTSRYRLRPDVRLTQLEDEGVVLHLGSREYFTVSETGLVILESLKQERTMEELAEALIDEYDVALDHATASAEDFVTRCLADGLVLRTEEE